jgi:hypothetical protein
VWPLLQALQAAAASGGGAAADALSVSGKAALACYLAVQRVVALTQLQEVSMQVVVGCCAGNAASGTY